MLIWNFHMMSAQWWKQSTKIYVAMRPCEVTYGGGFPGYSLGPSWVGVPLKQAGGFWWDGCITMLLSSTVLGGWFAGCSWPTSACSLHSCLICPQFCHLSAMSALAAEGDDDQPKVAHAVSPSRCKSVTPNEWCPSPVAIGLMSSTGETAKRDYI